MAKRKGRKGASAPPKRQQGPPTAGGDGDEHDKFDLRDYAVVIHAPDREEAEFYRRLLAERGL